MVTPPASRPAALTQRQVDDFAAGRQVEHATVLHVARSAPPDAAKTAEGSRPVDLKPADLTALASGKVPAGLSRRIAAATPEAGAVKGKAKAGAGKRPAKAGAQPSLAPPGAKRR